LATISRCYQMGGSSVVFAGFVALMLIEAVTITLTLYRAFRHFRHAANALIQNMTWDGFFYCVTMLNT
ncbi:hypothetical protein PAXRUDRAFT_159443, partial [Paxillus rubicundulus Ve08.2h10]